MRHPFLGSSSRLTRLQPDRRLDRFVFAKGQALQPFAAEPAKSPFSRFSKWTAHAAGHPITFLVAALIILAWAVTGPVFGFPDTWKLVINTGTIIVTFLMVFLIQNTQNLDSAAVQLKLDELIRAASGAHNALLDVEELTERDLEQLRGRYEKLARQAREDLQRGLVYTGSPDVSAR